MKEPTAPPAMMVAPPSAVPPISSYPPPPAYPGNSYTPINPKKRKIVCGLIDARGAFVLSCLGIMFSFLFLFILFFEGLVLLCVACISAWGYYRKSRILYLPHICFLLVNCLLLIGLTIGGSAHQNFVKQMDQAAMQQQNYLLMQAAAALSGAGSGTGSGSGKQGSSSNSASAAAAANDIVAQIAQLQAILQFTNSASGLTNASFNKAIEDALNLSKKDPTPVASTSSSSKPSSSAATSSSQKVSTPSISQKPSTSSATPAAASASSSTASTSSAAAASAASAAYAQMNSAEAAAFEKAALDQLGIGFAELMVLQSLDPNSIICMHNPETKHTVSGDKAPTLKNLEAYIRKNPKYKVDFNATLTALSATTLAAKTPSSSKASTSKASTQNGVSSSAANTPKVSTATAPSLPSLEPGEIPKASSSSNSASTSATPKAASNSNSSIANEYENIQISVFSKTGATINKDKFPTIKTLQTYLDKNPDMNVTSNHAPIAKTLLPKSYHNRIGGEAELYNQMAALMALNSSMFGLGGTSASTPSAFNLSGTSAGSSSSNNNNSNSAAAQQAQQALEAQMFLLQQSMNPLMGYNYASMLANMPGMSGTGLGGTSLSQFTTPTSSTSTKTNSTSAAKPSISAGTSSKSAAAAAAAAANAAAATSAATSSAAANNTASQMLTEAALTAEILNNPQLAQLFAMSMSGVGAGAPSTSSTSASAAAQNQLNVALYGMDANQMSQIQALNMLSMLAMPVLTAATPTPSTPAASTTKSSSSNVEKKASTSGTGNSTPTASKKSLGKIVEDLSKTPASSSS